MASKCDRERKWRFFTPSILDTGRMDALAAAASVVATHAEDYAPDDMELENAAGTSAGGDAPSTLVEPSLAGKENQGDLPVTGEQRTENPKVCNHS